jgi:hypothetical protein
MDTSRVGPGEWIAALGGVALLIALFFLDWYSLEPNIAPLEISASFLAQVDPPTEIPGLPAIPEVDLDLKAWDEQGFLGTVANLVMLAAAVWAIVALGLRASGGDVDIPMGGANLTALLGIAATVMVVLRILFPVDEIGGLEFDAGLQFGIFVALAGAVLIALGGVMSRGAAPVGPAAPTTGAPPPSPPPSGQPPPPPPPSAPSPPPAGGDPPPPPRRPPGT